MNQNLVLPKATPKRLDQLLSNLGYCSRRDAGKWAKEGSISVNGNIIKDASLKVDPHQVLLDGEPLDHPDSILIMLNKPLGYVCSHDTAEGPRIYDLLPPLWRLRKPQPVSIGRLDKETSGLLLITDYTPLVHFFTSPKNKIEKTYEVEVDKPFIDSLEADFASGTILIDKDDKPCLPAKFEKMSDTLCNLIITEGRYHQVRRMFAALGYAVVNLHRSRFGNYRLDGIAKGEFKEVGIL